MFYYFIPGASKSQVAPGDKIDRNFLASVGLAEVLADLAVCPGDATIVDYRAAPGRGPGALSSQGVLIAPVRKYGGSPTILLDGNLQTWRAGPAGKFWLGHLRGEQINPRHLERKTLVAGEEVQDRKGNLWTVPIARAPQFNAPYGTLPQSYTFDEAGQPVPQLVPEYQWLWDLSGEIQEWYRSSAPSPADAEAMPADREAPKRKIPFVRLVQYAARILGVNYRLGQEELNSLHALGVAVLDNATVHDICQASYGWQIEAEAKKKPEADEVSPAESSPRSTAGDATPDAAPGTDPVGAR